MNWLFETDPFIARAHCGDWPIWLVIVAIVSNLVIALAYILIPLLLYYFWRKKARTVPYNKVILFFGSFILFCGITHISDALMYYWPAYRLLILTDVLTATASLLTLLYLPKVILYFLDFKSPGEYKQIADCLEDELKLEREMYHDTERMMNLLDSRIMRLESEIQRRGWVDSQNLKLDELKAALQELKEKYNDPDKFTHLHAGSSPN